MTKSHSAGKGLAGAKEAEPRPSCLGGERGQGRGGLENQADKQDRTKVRPVSRGGTGAEVQFLASLDFQSEGGGGIRGSPLAVATPVVSELQGGWISFRDPGQGQVHWNGLLNRIQGLELMSGDHNRMGIYKVGANRTVVWAALSSTAVRCF